MINTVFSLNQRKLAWSSNFLKTSFNSICQMLYLFTSCNISYIILFTKYVNRKYNINTSKMNV